MLAYNCIRAKYDHLKLFWCLSTDQEQLEKEINNIREGLKAKVSCLNEMQGMKRILAF